jgi:hypothetical protein
MYSLMISSNSLSCALEHERDGTVMDTIESTTGLRACQLDDLCFLTDSATS